LSAASRQLSMCPAEAVDSDREVITTQGRTFQINNQIVSAFDLLIKDEHQRVLWSSVLHLSQDYFASLQKTPCRSTS